ncbi:MAG: magnesium transporter [Lachnospiraceae bacterium]|nr:magnesium transporter [Lachnospiraceae bacterium]
MDEKLERPDYEAEIIEIVRSNLSAAEMKDRLEDYHENDIAAALENMTASERKQLYHLMDSDMLSDIFEYVDEEEAAEYLKDLDVKETADIILHMDADKAVDLLRQQDKEKRNALIALLDDESRRDIALIASFDEDEIGSRMTTNYVVIKSNLTIKQAMHSMIQQAADNDNISKIYVTDEDDIFYGAIDLTDLIIARQGTSLESLIVTSYPYVYGHELIDDCIEDIKEYSEDSITILDKEKHIIGVITSQDTIQVVDDEMGEDYARLAGLTAEEDLKEPLFESMKKRMPWLIVLLVLGLLVSSVVGVFEGVMSELTMIVAFQSLILDMSGNAGTQSLAVTIRVLMDENLTGGQKAGLVFKEMKVGFFNGLLLGLISFLFIGLYIYFIKARTLLFSFAVSACIGLALLLAMMISSCTGTVIPMFFHKIKVDPAVASGPLITTVNDLVAVITYYGLAWIMLLNVLHIVE